MLAHPYSTCGLKSTENFQVIIVYLPHPSKGKGIVGRKFAPILARNLRILFKTRIYHGVFH